jgi:hypothetical protein
MTTVTKKKPTKKVPEKKVPEKKSAEAVDYNKLEFQPLPKQALMCVSQPLDWSEAFRKAAAEANVPLAAWVGEACKMALPPAIQKKLSVRRSKGRPKPKA